MKLFSPRVLSSSFLLPLLLLFSLAMLAPCWFVFRLPVTRVNHVFWYRSRFRKPRQSTRNDRTLIDRWIAASMKVLDLFRKDWNLRKKCGTVVPGSFRKFRLWKTAMGLWELDDKERERLGRRIDSARKDLGLTLAAVGNRAGYDERTVRSVIAGNRTKTKTLQDVCQAVNVVLEEAAKPAVAVAADEYGGYTLAQCDDCLGRYYVYRRSFSAPINIVRSIYQIEWNEDKRCLTFEENQKYQSSHNKSIDNSQSGDIYISSRPNLLHLLTKTRGALRLITLMRMRFDDQTMNGVVLTQSDRSFFYQPSVSPIIFQRADRSYSFEELATQVGRVRPGDDDYDRVNEMLIEVERNIGNFALAPRHPPFQVISSQS